MGCVQSVKLKPSFHENITVLELQASIDPSPTVIDESSNVVLRYRTPYFRASAQIQLGAPRIEMWGRFRPSVTQTHERQLLPKCDVECPVGTIASPPLLSSIQRDQRFNTWLVAMNETTAEMVLLRTIHWRMQLCIKVDPKKPLGQRATVLEPVIQEQPQVLVRNEPIPTNALLKPNANDAQVLMWRPRNGKPIVVIPPKYHEGYFLSF
ncbi:hypothetical protein F2P79_023907 [Pimephales promelas]|nr:hypothetical protein F2P79_023907 [Pimephales promelas]